MALDIDGMAVLQTAARHPGDFPDVAGKINLLARDILAKTLSGKAADLAHCRKVYALFGDETFRLLTDGFADSAIKSLVTKCDKQRPEVKTESARWLRQHLVALASGGVEPAEKPAKAPSARSKAKAPAAKANAEAVDAPAPAPLAGERKVLGYKSAGAIPPARGSAAKRASAKK